MLGVISLTAANTRPTAGKASGCWTGMVRRFQRDTFSAGLGTNGFLPLFQPDSDKPNRCVLICQSLEPLDLLFRALLAIHLLHISLVSQLAAGEQVVL